MSAALQANVGHWESLKLCAAAGMVCVGTVALDGTKLAGNASA